MANFKQAPELKFTGQKPEGQYYAIPQSLADIIFNELGNSSAQLRIMMVLIGTKEGFKISEKWILDRTGLLHASYITARKALVKRGWLSHRLASMLAEKQVGSRPIVLQVDGRTFAEISVESINQLTRQRGSLPLKLV